MNNLIYKLKKSDFADKITLIVAMVLLVVLFGALNRNYVTGANMINILIACSLTGFVAIGETNLIIANQNDLSAGSVAACAGVLAAILAREGVPAILALAIAVCAGFLVGAPPGTKTGDRQSPPKENACRNLTRPALWQPRCA